MARITLAALRAENEALRSELNALREINQRMHSEIEVLRNQPNASKPAAPSVRVVEAKPVDPDHAAYRDYIARIKAACANDGKARRVKGFAAWYAAREEALARENEAQMNQQHDAVAA